MGPQGRFSKDLIDNFIPEINEKTVHICGPGPMMDSIKLMLRELGVSSERINTEAFGPPPNKKENIIIDSADDNITSSKLTFTLSNKVTNIASKETVLEAAERNEIEIENSCRSGSCGMCKVKLLSGKVSMEVQDSLEEEEKKEDIILACQAKAIEDISIEA